MESNILQSQSYLAGKEALAHVANSTEMTKPVQLIASGTKPKKLLLLFAVSVLIACSLFLTIQHLMLRTDPNALLPSVVYYHRIKQGMSLDAVEKACGRPEYAQQKNEMGDEAEAWFYSSSDGTIEVLFNDGKVKRIRND